MAQRLLVYSVKYHTTPCHGEEDRLLVSERRDNVSQNLALHRHCSGGTRADNGIRPRAGAAAEDAVRCADVCGGEYYPIPILRHRRWDIPGRLHRDGSCTHIPGSQALAILRMDADWRLLSATGVWHLACGGRTRQ